MQRRFIQQPDRTEDAAHAPHILILKPGSRAPAHHHHADTVIARLKIGGEIEGRWQATILRITDPFAVAPQMKRGVDAIEDNLRLAVGPPALINAKGQ